MIFIYFYRIKLKSIRLISLVFVIDRNIRFYKCAFYDALYNLLLLIRLKKMQKKWYLPSTQIPRRIIET